MRRYRHLLFIPAYNCAPQVPGLLEEVFSYCSDIVSEVLIMDNRSRDNTLQEAKTVAERRRSIPVRGVCNLDNYGLGGSHKLAFDYAIAGGFDSVIVLHGDHQASPKEVLRLTRHFASHPALGAVLGSRFMPESCRTGYSTLRTLGNIALNKVYSTVLRKRVSDLGSGLNLFTTGTLRNLNYSAYSDRCDFNIFLLLDLLNGSAPVEFVPISWTEGNQKSNANPFAIGASALKILWMHKRDGLERFPADTTRGYETVFRYAF